MSKFKVGDRVRRVSGGNVGIQDGATGSVYFDYPECSIVKWDSCGMYATCSHLELESLEPAPSPVEPARPPEQYDYRLEHYSNAQFMQNMAQRNQDQGGGLGVLSALELENARLRKELEAYTAVPPCPHKRFGHCFECEASVKAPCDHEATISKLRAFSEDQARQIQKLETRLGETRDDLRDSERNFGRQARELDKLKRAK